MKNTLITLASVATLTGAANAQNLLTNGDFQSDDIADNTIVDVATQSLTGWAGGDHLVDGKPRSFDRANAAGEQYFYVHASTGVRALQTISLGSFATGFRFSADVGQAVVPTHADENRTLTMDLFQGIDVTAPAVASVSFTTLAGGGIVTHSSIEAGSFAAGDYTLTLKNTTTGSAVLGQMWVDNVSLEAVPEPSSTALLGLGGLALILRRRK